MLLFVPIMNKILHWRDTSIVIIGAAAHSLGRIFFGGLTRRELVGERGSFLVDAGKPKLEAIDRRIRDVRRNLEAARYISRFSG